MFHNCEVQNQKHKASHLRPSEQVIMTQNNKNEMLNFDRHHKEIQIFQIKKKKNPTLYRPA